MRRQLGGQASEGEEGFEEGETSPQVKVNEEEAEAQKDLQEAKDLVHFNGMITI